MGKKKKEPKQDQRDAEAAVPTKQDLVNEASRELLQHQRDFSSARAAATNHQEKQAAANFYSPLIDQASQRLKEREQALKEERTWESREKEKGMVSWLLSFMHYVPKHEPLWWQSNLEAGDPGKKGR